MSDRFRDLEEPAGAGRKNAVLLATVSSFEGMDRPTRNDLQQFTDLFVPLFEAAVGDARRIAAAALSRCRHVPAAVARAIVDQPIDIAAAFLVHARDLDDATLIDIVARHGTGHARAVARREGLSPAVTGALARLDDPAVRRTLVVRNLLTASAAAPLAPAPIPTPMAGETDRRRREDDLRNQLRALVMREKPDSPTPALAPAPAPLMGRIAPDIEDRLVRYARGGEAVYFTTALADALGSGFELAERIMLDVSGRQLAQTLVALGMRYTMIVVALERFFPHLAKGEKEKRRSLEILRSCAFVDCVERIAAWQRADQITRRPAVHQPFTVDLPSAPRSRGAQKPQPENAARHDSGRRARSRRA